MWLSGSGFFLTAQRFVVCSKSGNFDVCWEYHFRSTANQKKLKSTPATQNFNAESPGFLKSTCGLWLIFVGSCGRGLSRHKVFAQYLSSLNLSLGDSMWYCHVEVFTGWLGGTALPTLGEPKGWLAGWLGGARLLRLGEPTGGATLAMWHW